MEDEEAEGAEEEEEVGASEGSASSSNDNEILAFVGAESSAVDVVVTVSRCDFRLCDAAADDEEDGAPTTSSSSTRDEEEEAEEEEGAEEEEEEGWRLARALLDTNPILASRPPPPLFSISILISTPFSLAWRLRWCSSLRNWKAALVLDESSYSSYIKIVQQEILTRKHTTNTAHPSSSTPPRQAIKPP